jgi:glycosyltransferase involved in cell wall biosynthesis
MACLNAEATIERAICSVRNQTNIIVEHIIIDGGSRDTTVAIVEKYKNHIAYFISEPDCGISDALNKGINKAHGNRICILGSK